MDSTLKFTSRRQALARYAPPAIFFHWAIACLIALAYAMVITRGYLPRTSPARPWIMNIHEWAGTLVITLAVPRLLWRLIKGAPPALPDLTWWQRLLSSVVHLLLYLFFFAQPILGYLIINASGHGLRIAPGIQTPQFIGADKAMHHTLVTFHVTLGTAFYWVIGLHALAALWHHYFRRDDTLRRML